MTAAGGSQRTIAQKWWRFVATGLMVNGALFAALWLLLDWGLDYRIAVTLTFVIGVSWSYAQNRLWTWKSDVPIMRSTLRYLALYGGVYFIHMGLVMSFVKFGGLSPMLATLASVALLIVPNFLAMNLRVFRSSQR